MKNYNIKIHCKCPICKSTGDDCGIMMGLRSVKWNFICSSCRRGDHCNDSKEKYPFKKIGVHLDGKEIEA